MLYRRPPATSMGINAQAPNVWMVASDRLVPRNGRPRTAIPEATVARLTIYGRALVDLAEDGVETVLSQIGRAHV